MPIHLPYAGCKDTLIAVAVHNTSVDTYSNMLGLVQGVERSIAANAWSTLLINCQGKQLTERCQ